MVKKGKTKLTKTEKRKRIAVFSIIAAGLIVLAGGAFILKEYLFNESKFDAKPMTFLSEVTGTVQYK